MRVGSVYLSMSMPRYSDFDIDPFCKCVCLLCIVSGESTFTMKCLLLTGMIDNSYVDSMHR